MLFASLMILLSFDPTATVRALKHDEAREGSLVQLFSLDYLSLKRARTALVGEAVARVALDPRLPVRERIIALRAISHLQARSQAAGLSALLLLNAKGSDVAIAREAARTLFRLGARHELLPGLGAEDPAVRAYAARSGAGGVALCGPLVSDPWPFVRSAAAEGLAVVPRGTSCLAKALDDGHQDVRQAAVRSLGEARVESSVPRLESFVRSAKTSMGLRIDALYALGQIGALKAPKAILGHHLSHGGLERLAHGALLALLVGEADLDLVIRAVGSSSPRVAIAAATGLIERGDPQARVLAVGLRDRLKGAARADIVRLLTRLDPPGTLGEGRGADAPEDSEDVDELSK